MRRGEHIISVRLQPAKTLLELESIRVPQKHSHNR